MAIDMECCHNWEWQLYSATQTATPGANNKKPAANSGTRTGMALKPFQPFTSSDSGQVPITKPTIKFSTSIILPLKPTLGIKDNICFLYKQPSHWKQDCPELPVIKAMIYKLKASREDADK